MGRPEIGWLTNGLGPLERETYDDLKGWGHRDWYARTRLRPLGRTPYGRRKLEEDRGHHYDAETLEVHVNIMLYEEFAFYGNVATEAGRFTELNLTLRDIIEVPNGESVDPGARPTGAGLWPFLKTFGLMYRKRTHLEFLRSGKEIGLAKTVLKKCGGDSQLASRLVSSFFNMPLGIGPDDMNFTVFTFYVDKLMAQEAIDRQWDDARIEGAKDAAARHHIPTAEEDVAFHAEAARYREESRARKEREARIREDNAS
jgi:hypothetical protein